MNAHARAVQHLLSLAIQIITIFQLSKAHAHQEIAGNLQK